ncbi:MAG: hypothetical protein WD226_06000 [Planctomycetota bacterium]
MNRFFQGTLLAAAAGAALTSSASAAEILVTSDITSSTTWTAGNTYNLQTQVYVRNGATLTIEAGVVVASTTGIGGSLAVARDSQIFVNGTASAPVIMTSTADVATWTGGDPSTGLWRPTANEWGNLTICGNGYISENVAPGGGTNVPTPDANNQALMEGLTSPPAPAPADLPYYGGGNDDDDSGSISYLSMRYGGRVLSFGVELNGLALGGVGRGTDMNFIEIMNNVDDGIEIWGGTVNLKNFSIWNVGDDSFDVDQGWRGKAQFGLIVQGYSLDLSQGGGIGDNCFEMDGAERSDWQPVTTSQIYNCTVIGQPEDGDHGTAWRDNARLQFRNCIFMDIGDEVVRFDGDGGEGLGSYGFNGTLSWADTWTTDDTVYSTVNAPANPAAFYTVQSGGKLAEIKDSVFYNNLDSSAYNQANLRGVFDPANNNVLEPAVMPIVSIARGPVRTLGNNKDMLPVVSLDPRAAGDAVTSVAAAPNDGFYTVANYRGAFDATTNWLQGWTAADAFDFCPDAATTTAVNSVNNVQNSLSTNDRPYLGNANFAFTVSVPAGSACNAGPGSVALLFTTTNGNPFSAPLGLYGCGGGSGDLLIFPNFNSTAAAFYTGAPVSFPVPLPAQASLCGFEAAAQCAFFNGPGDIEAGSAVRITLGS